MIIVNFKLYSNLNKFNDDKLKFITIVILFFCLNSIDCSKNLKQGYDRKEFFQEHSQLRETFANNIINLVKQYQII